MHPFDTAPQSPAQKYQRDHAYGKPCFICSRRPRETRITRRKSVELPPFLQRNECKEKTQLCFKNPRPANDSLFFKLFNDMIHTTIEIWEIRAFFDQSCTTNLQNLLKSMAIQQ